MDDYNGDFVGTGMHVVNHIFKEHCEKKTCFKKQKCIVLIPTNKGNAKL